MIEKLFVRGVVIMFGFAVFVSLLSFIASLMSYQSYKTKSENERHRRASILGIAVSLVMFISVCSMMFYLRSTYS